MYCISSSPSSPAVFGVLSSRPQWRDPQFAQPASNPDGSNHSNLCHPDRSGGTCSSLNQHPIRTEETTLTFVIPSEVEGPAVRSISIRSGRKQNPNLCHPDRRDLRFSQPASDPDGTRSPPLCHPACPGVPGTGAKRSGGTCGSLNQHPIRTEPTPLTFVIPTEVEGSAVQRSSSGPQRPPYSVGSPHDS
jgi:hypothetical protein